MLRRTASGDGQGVQVSSPAVAVLAALRWLAEGRAGFRASVLQKQQQAAPVGAGAILLSPGSVPSPHQRRAP